MKQQNLVFIATSIDGYIADRNGGIDWLHAIPNPDGSDFGYSEFVAGIDALVMGRNTFETVLGFGDWPYKKPVFVLSNSLQSLPEGYEDKAQLVQGTLTEILQTIHGQGYFKLYIDGGKTIQRFLQEDLIDSMVITIIPTLLGGGISLFGELLHALDFECSASVHYPNKLVQNTFVRKR